MPVSQKAPRTAAPSRGRPVSRPNPPANRRDRPAFDPTIGRRHQRGMTRRWRTSVLDFSDLADNKAQPRYVTLQLGQAVRRQRHALRGVHGCQTLGRPPPSRGQARARVGLKLRMPSRARVDLIRFTIRVRSPTRQSRSRFGRLASSSAIVGTRAMVQWPALHAATPRTRASATRCRAGRFSLGDAPARPRGSRHGSREPRRHASPASAPAKSRRGRLRNLPLARTGATAIRVIVRPALTASSRQRCSRASSRSGLGSSFLHG